MRGSTTTFRVVDVVRIYADQSSTRTCQILRCRGRQKRVLATPILFSAPVKIPIRLKQNSLVFYIEIAHYAFINFPFTSIHEADNDAINICKRV